MNHSIPAMQPPRELASLSCVVPCYNEARNLEQLLPLLRAQLARYFPALTAGVELVPAGLGAQVGDYAALALLQQPG